MAPVGVYMFVSLFYLFASKPKSGLLQLAAADSAPSSAVGRQQSSRAKFLGSQQRPTSELFVEPKNFAIHSIGTNFAYTARSCVQRDPLGPGELAGPQNLSRFAVDRHKEQTRKSLHRDFSCWHVQQNRLARA